MTVYGFTGPSGTGKSHRALEVARRLNVPCILDDGLLIRENIVLAGKSSKREASRLASVRRALYTEQAHADEVRSALDASGAQSVMILGTSVHMVDEIAKRLGLPRISTYITIGDVASEAEIDAARNVRMKEGKHVIPAPTFALKKEFSGYFLAPLRRLVKRGRKAGGGISGIGKGVKAGDAAAGAYAGTHAGMHAGTHAGTHAVTHAVTQAGAAEAGKGAAIGEPPDGDRTVVRPTFSYLGGYTISRAAIEQLINCIAVKTDGIVRVTGVNVDFTDGGLEIGLAVCVRYGIKIHSALDETVGRLRAEIDRQTSLHIREIQVTAKSLEIA